MIVPALITLAIDGALTGYMLLIWKIGAYPSSIIDILEFVSYAAFIMLYMVKLLRTGHKNIIRLYGINPYQFSEKRLNEMKAEIKRRRALELEKK
ncbi:MAG: hypothetical protein AAE976_06785 [Thermoplasmataceae archaeon]|jgi:hypothetical protein|nr:MAG: hypothetical protein RE469_04540 [Cuniculiplasma divulgatum]